MSAATVRKRRVKNAIGWTFGIGIWVLACFSIGFFAGWLWAAATHHL